MISRTARVSSRSEVIFAMATGVVTCVRRSGMRAPSAAVTSSGGGAHPPVMSTHGMSCANALDNAVSRSGLPRLSRYRISLSPNTSTRPGRRYSAKPDNARPVF